jgi:hypothetical protein
MLDFKMFITFGKRILLSLRAWGHEIDFNYFAKKWTGLGLSKRSGWFCRFVGFVGAPSSDLTLK